MPYADQVIQTWLRHALSITLWQALSDDWQWQALIAYKQQVYDAQGT